MTLGLLLTPHANARYFHSIRNLSLAEFTVMNRQLNASEPSYRPFGGIELLCFEYEGDLDTALALLERHASCQAVFAIQENLLKPLLLPRKFVYDHDIGAIQKYKGKTNERFTSLLMNIAVFSGAFAAKYGEALQILDPMAGRATTLLEGLKNGYTVSGIEIDKTDVRQANQFLISYLQYHKVKHEKKNDSMTAKGRPAGERTRVLIGGEEKWTLVRGDTADAPAFYKPAQFDAIAADLPYGIQHKSMTGKSRGLIHALMRQALPAWRRLIKPGGAIALSFNANNVSLETLRAMLEEAGWTPLTGGAYDGFRHWVEQAVDRDIAVAVRHGSHS